MNNWFAPSRSAAVVPARPWLSDEAITLFESLLQPNFFVLEFGSGGSTLWLAERVSYVRSYETNIKWLQGMMERIPDHVEMRYRAVPDEREKYNLLFIDGEPLEFRAAWITEAHELVHPGGYVVLDNANRPELEQFVSRLAGRARLLRRTNPAPGTQFTATDFYQFPE